jgi:hypothetical protein
MAEERKQEKKERTRRPKERPPFYQTDNTEVKIPSLKIQTFEYYNPSPYDTLIICPYTKFVPISYLKQHSNTHQGRAYASFRNKLREDNVTRFFSIDSKGWEPEKLPKKIYDLIDYTMAAKGNYVLESASNQKGVYANVEAFIKEDRRTTFHATRYASTMSDALTFFESETISTVSFRTYQMQAGCFSVIVAGNPYIMAVIPREKYLYHRTRVLLGLPLDLSKVVILIDRRLDLPGEDDIPKAFKALYQKTLENTIKSTGAMIFKVPLEFIKENCFLSDFAIKSKNKKERQTESSIFLTNFYKSLGVQIERIEQEQFEEMLTEHGINPNPIEVVAPREAIPAPNRVTREQIEATAREYIQALDEIEPEIGPIELIPIPTSDPHGDRLRAMDMALRVAEERRVRMRREANERLINSIRPIHPEQYFEAPTPTPTREPAMTDAERAAMVQMQELATLLNGVGDPPLPEVPVVRAEEEPEEEEEAYVDSEEGQEWMESDEPESQNEW